MGAPLRVGEEKMLTISLAFQGHKKGGWPFVVVVVVLLLLVLAVEIQVKAMVVLGKENET